MHNNTINRLTTEKRARVIAALVEGNSVRSTVRMTGAAKNTVAKLVVDLGTTCKKYQDEHLRNMKCKLIQCDEIWSFCYCKEKRLPEEMRGTLGLGDVWTWVAIDADSKLAVNWLVGKTPLSSQKHLSTTSHPA